LTKVDVGAARGGLPTRNDPVTLTAHSRFAGNTSPAAGLVMRVFLRGNGSQRTLPRVKFRKVWDTECFTFK
jgi:hypothetical protein